MHLLNHRSQWGDDIERKVQELEAKLREIYMGDHYQNNFHDFNTLFPFFEKIKNELISHWFKMLSVKSYDSSIDSVDYLQGYKVLMRLQGIFNALLYLAFPVTLKKAIRMWFSSLLSRPIHSF